jgi:hypothetical protein
MLSNTTALGEVFARIDAKFDLMYAKRGILLLFFFLDLRMITLEENDIQSIRFFSNTVNIQYSIFT